MFQHPAPVTTPAASPLETPRQNDFRETSVSAEAEQRTWHDRRAATSPPAKYDATREANPDEWLPVTIAAGALDTTPRLLIGDDAERRSVVVLNIGTDPVLLAPQQSALNGGTAVATAFLLPVAASVTLTTTRQIWVVATTGTNAGVSAIIEKGVRTR